MRLAVFLQRSACEQRLFGAGRAKMGIEQIYPRDAEVGWSYLDGVYG